MWVQSSQWTWRLIAVLHQDTDVVVGVKWALACQHLIEDDADRVDVAGLRGFA